MLVDIIHALLHGVLIPHLQAHQAGFGGDVEAPEILFPTWIQALEPMISSHFMPERQSSTTLVLRVTEPTVTLQ